MTTTQIQPNLQQKSSKKPMKITQTHHHEGTKKKHNIITT